MVNLIISYAPEFDNDQTLHQLRVTVETKLTIIFEKESLGYLSSIIKRHHFLFEDIVPQGLPINQDITIDIILIICKLLDILCRQAKESKISDIIQTAFHLDQNPVVSQPSSDPLDDSLNNLFKNLLECKTNNFTTSVDLMRANKITTRCSCKPINYRNFFESLSTNTTKQDSPEEEYLKKIREALFKCIIKEAAPRHKQQIIEHLKKQVAPPALKSCAQQQVTSCPSVSF